MKQMTRVAIGLGSNRGDRAHFLSQAYARLREDLLLKPAASPVYETPPWGGVARETFLNAVVTGETDWKPPAIVNFLKELERELGRTPAARYADREIDLDLLAYGEVAWDADGVVVPHPGLPSRAFVLVPFCDLWPQWKHPGSGLTARELLEALPASERCLRLNKFDLGAPAPSHLAD